MSFCLQLQEMKMTGIRRPRLLQLVSMAVLFYPKSCTDARNISDKITMIPSTKFPTSLLFAEKIYSMNLTFPEDRLESTYHEYTNAQPTVTTLKITTTILSDTLLDSDRNDMDDHFHQLLTPKFDNSHEVVTESDDNDEEEILDEYEKDSNQLPREMSALQYHDDYEELPSRTDLELMYYAINIIFSIFGIVGNILVAMTWSKVQHSKSTVFLLSFLGMTDFVFTLAMLTIHVYFMSVPKFTYAISWVFYCTVYISYAAQYLSIFTTSLVSITRYIAVKFPFKVNSWFKNSTIKVILVILIGFSSVAAFPATIVTCLYLYFFDDIPEYEDYPMENHISGNDSWQSFQLLGKAFDAVYSQNSSGTFNTVTPFLSDKIQRTTAPQELQALKQIEVCSSTTELQKKIFLFITATMMNIIPWIVVIPMNLLLINQVRKSFNDRKKMLSKEEQNNSTMDVVVVIVSLQSILAYPLFFIIELLTNTIDWAYYFGGEPPLVIAREYSSHITSLKDCFHIINSSLNILAYCACGRRFRKILVEEVFKYKPKKLRSAEKTSKAKGVQSTEQGISSNSHQIPSQTTPEAISQAMNDP